MDLDDRVGALCALLPIAGKVLGKAAKWVSYGLLVIPVLPVIGCLALMALLDSSHVPERVAERVLLAVCFVCYGVKTPIVVAIRALYYLTHSRALRNRLERRLWILRHRREIDDVIAGLRSQAA